MNTKKIIRLLIPTITLLLLIGIATPVLACTPKGTYMFVSIGYPGNPGTNVVSNNEEHIKGEVTTGVDYGYPWGTDSWSHIGNSVFDLTSYMGSSVGVFTKTFQKGTLVVFGTASLDGLGYYTYYGPMITAQGKDSQGNSIQVKISNGEQFAGLLVHGLGNGEGIIDHHLVTTSEKVTGLIIELGPLTGDSLYVGMGTYWG